MLCTLVAGACPGACSGTRAGACCSAGARSAPIVTLRLRHDEKDGDKEDEADN